MDAKKREKSIAALAIKNWRERERERERGL